MKIPKRFKLLGQTIEVKEDKMLSDNDGLSGQARYRYNEIILQPSGETTPRPAEIIEQSFYHELVHWILLSMGEEELGKNEKFVDLFAGLLHQAETTKEYK